METFKESFCRRYNCSPEQYVPKALFRCFYLHARLLAPLLRRLDLKTIDESVAFLEDAGRCFTSEEVEDAIRDYHYRLKYQGTFLANALRFRVSGNIVMRLNAKFRKKEPITKTPKKLPLERPSTATATR